MTPSDVLMVGAELPKPNPLGAAFARSLAEARLYVERHPPAVVVFGGGGVPGELERFGAFLMEAAPGARWILLEGELDAARLLELGNFGPLHGLAASLNDPDLEGKIRAALERHDGDRQDRRLGELAAEQGLALERLGRELDLRVEKRHRGLAKSQAALDKTKTRMHAYHAAQLAIHRAGTVRQMEAGLVEALERTVPLRAVRIRAEAAPPRVAADGDAGLPVELPHVSGPPGGEARFFRGRPGAFTPFESGLLRELGEAIGLALARLKNLERAEQLKSEWQATFDSIPHALALLGPGDEILKLNRAFAETLGRDIRLLLGQNAFDVFFGPGTAPPAAVEPRASFRATRASGQATDTFETTVQKIGPSFQTTLALFRRITDEVRFERRILNASKLAELGTIGSSIAHELNNPLGGMLSFLQLIRMDLPDAHPLGADVRAMEQAVYRCRDIVLNLLSFARKRDLGEFTRLDLRGILARAVKLVGLRAGPAGVEVTLALPGDAGGASLASGSADALVQCFTDVLQNAVDAVCVRRAAEPALRGRVEIALASDAVIDKPRWIVTVRDNGDGIPASLRSKVFNPLFTTRDPAKHQGMGLTTVFTILGEHHGDIELGPAPGGGTLATIRLAKVD